MKIAFIVPSLKNKGPIIVVKELAEYFMKMGHSCCIYYFDNTHELEIPCRLEQISFFRSYQQWNQFDIVHVHCLRPALYVWMHSSSFNGTVLVSTLHQPFAYKTYRLVYSPLKAFLLSRIVPFLQNKFECNVVLSSEQMRLMREKLKTRVVTINNGRNVFASGKIDNSNSLLIAELSKKYKIIGSVSVVIKRKGIEQIVKALLYLSDFAFVCIGDGEELLNLKILAEKIGVSNRCLWLGYQKNVVDYYRLFDVYVLPSRSEGYPLSLIEAASQHSACVISNIKILTELFPKHCVGIFELDNLHSLADEIIETYNNRYKYGENFYNYYINYLTADAMGDNYLRLFSQLLQQKE